MTPEQFDMVKAKIVKKAAIEAENSDIFYMSLALPVIEKAVGSVLISNSELAKLVEIYKNEFKRAGKSYNRS